MRFSKLILSKLSLVLVPLATLGLACTVDEAAEAESGSQLCVTSSQCAGSQHCATFFEVSDVGMCTAACGASSDCGSGVCVDGLSPAPSCLQRCSSGGECASGFDCALIDDGLATCVPASWLDSSSGGTGGSGGSYTTGTGGSYTAGTGGQGGYGGTAGYGGGYTGGVGGQGGYAGSYGGGGSGGSAGSGGSYTAGTGGQAGSAGTGGSYTAGTGGQGGYGGTGGWGAAAGAGP